MRTGKTVVLLHNSLPIKKTEIFFVSIKYIILLCSAKYYKIQ